MVIFVTGGINKLKILHGLPANKQEFSQRVKSGAKASKLSGRLHISVDGGGGGRQDNNSGAGGVVTASHGRYKLLRRRSRRRSSVGAFSCLKEQRIDKKLNSRVSL